MFSRRFFTLACASLIIFTSACTIQIIPAGPVVSTLDSTAAGQTQVAEIVASTLEAGTELANAVAETLAALATNTPEFTFTPSLTSTPSFTFTPAVPMVSVSVETNCRSGPGKPYDILGVLQVGVSAAAVQSDHHLLGLDAVCHRGGEYFRAAFLHPSSHPHTCSQLFCRFHECDQLCRKLCLQVQHHQ
jgi:hypothetical protein